MKNRKDVLKLIRKNVEINSATTFSEKRKSYQRVKFWYIRDSGPTVQKIRDLLTKNNITDVTVDIHKFCRYQSIVLQFPYNNYC